MIGKSFEAHVKLYVTDGIKQELDSLDADIRQAMIVSALDILPIDEAPADADDYDEVKVKIEKATGEVCPRCRMIKNDVGADQELPQVCAHCAEIIRHDFPEAVEEGLED